MNRAALVRQHSQALSHPDFRMDPITYRLPLNRRLRPLTGSADPWRSHPPRRSRAPGFPDTAGGEFHPAPRTVLPTCV